MGRIIALWSVLLLSLTPASSQASEADSRAIITKLRPMGLTIPYISQTNFDYPSEFVFDSVYSCLWRRSAEILVYDKVDGILTWCDTSVSFIPLPTDAASDTLEQVTQMTANRNGGYTYGSALITKMAGSHTLFSVFTIGRSPDLADETYSDGTYERELINSVGRRLYRLNIGQAQTSPPPPYRSKPSIQATNYASAFRGRFQNMPDCPVDSIKATGKGTPYSVPASQLWAGLLPVILQYDVVIDLQPAAYKAIFARRLTVPVPDHADIIRRADTFMVALVEPVTTNSCTYYLAALDERTLAPMPIATQGTQTQDSRMPLDDNIPDSMKAAIIVAGQMDRQIDMQMFYLERWGDKFLRRSGTLSTHQP